MHIRQRRCKAAKPCRNPALLLDGSWLALLAEKMFKVLFGRGEHEDAESLPLAHLLRVASQHLDNVLVIETAEVVHLGLDLLPVACGCLLTSIDEDSFPRHDHF